MLFNIDQRDYREELDYMPFCYDDQAQYFK